MYFGLSKNTEVAFEDLKQKITPKTINDIFNNILSTISIINYIENDDELINYVGSSCISSNYKSITLLRDYINNIFNLLLYYIMV